jgi:hypothetical protein
LTSLIAHGHGDETFVQYSNEFWPNDLNSTIGSLLQLLWTLEKEPINEFRILFEHEPQSDFFQRLMYEGFHYLATLKAIEEFISRTHCLKNCFCKWTICVKDNKNQDLHIVLFFLITREVFEIVQQGFLNGQLCER